MEEIRDYSLVEFEKLLLVHFKNIHDLELLILKGHILTEFTINCNLEVLSNKSEANFFKERFTFDSKIKILEHFGNFEHSSDQLIKSLKLLNKLRNGIAHTLSVNEQLLVEYLSSVKTMASEIFINDDQELRLQFSMATGFLSGVLFSIYYEKKNESLNSQK